MARGHRSSLGERFVECNSFCPKRRAGELRTPALARGARNHDGGSRGDLCRGCCAIRSGATPFTRRVSGPTERNTDGALTQTGFDPLAAPVYAVHDDGNVAAPLADALGLSEDCVQPAL